MPVLNKELVYSLLFLPVIFFIGFLTSYEDIKTSKIKNRVIIFVSIYCLAIYLSAWAVNLLVYYKILNSGLGIFVNPLIWNFPKWCINLLVSAGVAYLLWHFKTWGAGDAKLFIAYVMLIPIGQYSRVYFKYYFAAFWLLVTTFVSATIFLLIKSIIFLVRERGRLFNKNNIFGIVKEELATYFKKNFITSTVGFFILFLIFGILRNLFYSFAGKIIFEQSFITLIFLIIFRYISGLFKKYIEIICVGAIILISAAFFVNKALLSCFLMQMATAFANSVFLILLFPVFNKIVNFYSERSSRKTMPFAPWLFIGTLIVWFFRFNK